MSGNLGQSTLRRARRAQCPMERYDALPAPLRQWLAQAALPWSPTSVRRIWAKSQARGLSAEDALQHLNHAEARMLAKDAHSVRPLLSPTT